MSNGSIKEPAKKEPPNRIVLASWRERFLAWLIDFIIITICIDVFIEGIIGIEANIFERGPLDYIVTSLIFFTYWTYFESTMSLSIGKKVMNLRITDNNGNTADRKAIAISSFGKSFLLPIDVILGWIFANYKKQRIFNKISNTIVIKVKPDINSSKSNIVT